MTQIRYPADERRTAKLLDEWGKDWCGALDKCYRRNPCPYHMAKVDINRRSMERREAQ